MIYLGPGGNQLAFDLLGIALLALVVLCLLVAAALATLRVRTLVRPLLVGAVLVSLVQLPRSVMAPQSARPAMVAAVQAAEGDMKLGMVRDIRENWRYRDITAVLWYVVSRKWGVCHELWPQATCSNPPGPHEAVGIAREILDDIASGQGEWVAYQ